jgi:hypothetical protein
METKRLNKTKEEKFVNVQKNQRHLRETNLVQFSVSDRLCNLLAISEPEFPRVIDFDSQDIFIGVNDQST